MRRSAVSVPSNVADGTRRKTAVYINHLEIALGSYTEPDTRVKRHPSHVLNENHRVVHTSLNLN